MLCNPIKGIENVCVGPKELLLEDAVSYCKRLGYELATFRDEKSLIKVAKALSLQSSNVDKYMVGLTFDKNKAIWYDNETCTDKRILGLFYDDIEDFLNENKDCFDAVMKVKYREYSFGLEVDCGKQPYKFLCSTPDVIEETETIATSTLVSTARINECTLTTRI